MIAYLERLQQENEIHDDAHAETGSTSKKTRGPTLGLPIWRRMTQVNVVYDHIGNPIAPKSVVKELITFIGCLARMSKYCPIDFASWMKVPSDGQEKAWKQIEKRFSTNQSDVGVKMVEKDKDGKSPTRGELFISSYTRKDGKIHKSATEEVKKVNDVLAAFEGDENQIEKSGPNDIVSQALGKGGHGRIISVGFRATATNTLNSNERSGTPVVANNAAQEEINALKAQLAAYQVLHEELAAKVTKLTELVENQQGQLRTTNLADA